MAKLKEWQVFLYLIAASILSNFTIEGKQFLIVFLPVGIWFLQPRINKYRENADA